METTIFFRVIQGLGFRVIQGYIGIITPIMENQMKNHMEKTRELVPCRYCMGIVCSFPK